MTGHMDEVSDPYKEDDYRYIQNKPKIDKMGKLKRELEFLKRGMQRVKTELQKLQQDLTLTPSTSMVEIRPKQFVDQHDYHIMKQCTVQNTYDHDRHIGLYSTSEQQIRADAIFSRQIYNEEPRQFEKQTKQVDNKRFNEWHLNSMRNQTIPNQSNFLSKDRKESLTYLEFLTEQKCKHLS